MTDRAKLPEFPTVEKNCDHKGGTYRDRSQAHRSGAFGKQSNNGLLSEPDRTPPTSAHREYGVLSQAQESHGGGAAPLGI